MRRNVKLLLIVLLSVTVRLVIPSSSPMLGISQVYRDIAANIREQHGYVTRDGSLPIAYYLPGYAYAKALFGD